jgi:hypothetical protein
MKLDGKTNAELTAMSAAIEADPKNQLSGSIYRFTPAARKKLDEIGRAITNNLAAARAAAGNPVRADGYSGRQTNRRR